MLDPGGGGAPKKVKKSTPVTVNATLGGAGVAGASAAARAARRGGNPARAASSAIQAYGPSGSSAASTTAPSTVNAALSRQRQAAQRQARKARQKQAVVAKAVRTDPPKAEKLVKAKTQKIWERLDVKDKGKAPKIELGAQKTKPVVRSKPTVQLSKVDAKRFFSPKAQVRKATRRKVVKKALVAQTRTEDPKIQGKTEKKAATRLKKALDKSKGGLAQKLDRGFGPDETITQKQAAIVAEAQGLPGKTYGQIAIGESGLKPGIPNPDDGTPSLFQMTPSVQSAETIAKWDRIASKHPGGYTNPIVAAKQAKVLAGEGTGTSNYFGTGAVTDMNAHLPGGPKAARQKLRGKPEPIPKSVKKTAKKELGKQKTKQILGKSKPEPQKESKPRKIPTLINIGKEAQKKFGVEAREMPFFDPVEPVHTTNSMHYSGDAIDFQGTPAQLSALNKWLAENYASQIDEMFYDPGISIADGQETAAIGGHSDHLHLGLKIGKGESRLATGLSGAVSGAASFGSVSTGGVTTGGTSAPTASQAPSKGGSKKRKARKMEGREKQRLLRELISQGPAAAEEVVSTPATDYDSYARSRRVSVSV